MLRQWVNERPRNRLVTNEDIKLWLTYDFTSANEQDHSHAHCYKDQAGHEDHLRCCLCYKENMVK